MRLLETQMTQYCAFRNKQAFVNECYYSYCRMSLQQQYTIHCKGLTFLFGRSGVSAPVVVNGLACGSISSRRDASFGM
jgi:hypothetical protein